MDSDKVRTPKDEEDAQSIKDTLAVEAILALTTVASFIANVFIKKCAYCNYKIYKSVKTVSVSIIGIWSTIHENYIK